MVLVTGEFNQLESAFSIVEEFCLDTNLELNLGKDSKDKSKTVWSTNDMQMLDIKIEFIDRFKIHKSVPRLENNECYSYLDVMLNLRLDWAVQKSVLKMNLLRYLIPLRSRYYSIQQTVETINKVFIPAITYRMAVIPLNTTYLNSLDNIIARVVNSKYGIHFRSSKLHLYQKGQYGAVTLKSLADVQKESLVRGLYDQGLHGIDRKLSKLLDFMLNCEMCLWTKYLKKSKVSFVLASEEGQKRFSIKNWVGSEVSKNVRSDWSVWDFVNLAGKFIPYEEVPLTLPKELYQQIRLDVVDPDGNVNPFLLYQVGLSDKIQLFEASEVWVNGSFKNDVSSYAIFYGNQGYSSGVLPKKMKQSNNRGELTAACLGLIQTKFSESVTFYTDSQYMYDIANCIIKNRNIPRRKYLQNRDIIDVIKSLIDWKLMNGKTVMFKHVNSHLLDKNAKRKVKNYDKKIVRMKRMYGNDWE